VNVDARKEAERGEPSSDSQTEKPKGQHRKHIENKAPEKNVKNTDLDKIQVRKQPKTPKESNSEGFTIHY
jgi:hypothetical protein